MSKARELAELGAAYDSGALSNRNLIINGAMQVAQRGTSQTGTGYGSVDRMSLALSGGTATMSQQTNSATDRATTGFDKYLRLAFSAGNNNGGLNYKIEAADIIQAIGKKITLSFFAKGTNPNGGSFEVIHFWYDGSNVDNGTSGTLTVTSTWTKYSITLDTATVSSASLTAALSSYHFAIQQPNGDTSTNAWTLDITGLQLEVGTEATPFEHRSFGDELALCQRYYQRQTAGTNQYSIFLTGSIDTTSNIYLYGKLNGTMRTSPSFATANTYLYTQPGGTLTYAATSNRSGPEVASINFGTISGGTQGYGIRFESNAGNGYVEFDAEL